MRDFSFNRMKVDVAEADSVIAAFDRVSQVISSILAARFWVHYRVDARQDIDETAVSIVVHRKIDGGPSSKKMTRRRVNNVYIRSALITDCLDSLAAGQDYSKIIESALAYDDTLLASVAEHLKRLKVNEAFMARESTKKSMELISNIASKRTLDDLQAIVDSNGSVITEFDTIRDATLSGLSVICHDISSTWSLYSNTQRRQKPSPLAKYQHQLADESAWLYKYASNAHE